MYHPSSPSYMLRIAKRRIEKSQAEMNEIIRMQNEEIERLTQELNSKADQLNEREIQNEKISLVLREKVMKLKQELQSEVTKRAILKSHTSVYFAKSLEELNAEHERELSRMRIEYESKMEIAKARPLTQQDDVVFTDILDSIGKTRLTIAESLKKRDIEKEENIQIELERLNQLVIQHKYRYNQLQNLILEKTKEKSELIEKFKKHILTAETTKINRVYFLKELEDSQEETLHKIKTDFQIKEDQIKIKLSEENDLLRKDLVEANQRLIMMKTGVDTGRTKTSSRCDQALEEKIKIEKELDDLVLGIDKSRNSRLLKILQKEYKDIEYLRLRYKKYLEQREILMSEKNHLTSEVRRIDFVLFGKSGKHQIKNEKKKTGKVFVL